MTFALSFAIRKMRLIPRRTEFFLSPRPGKLLQEGDAYALKFGSDQTAYEDYQELLGSTGERTTNYHFNEYEWQRGKTKEPESIERACAEMDDMEEEELLLLEEKLESGFYPLKKSQPYLRRIQELLRRKKELCASWNKTHLSDGERESKGHSQQFPWSWRIEAITLGAGIASRQIYLSLLCLHQIFFSFRIDN